MAGFTVECGVLTYRIMGPGGEEGERVSWDSIATIKIGGEIYYCEGDCDADEQVVERVKVAEQQSDVTTDYISFEDEPSDDEGDEDGEEEDEDEDEEEEVGPELVS